MTADLNLRPTWPVERVELRSGVALDYVDQGDRDGVPVVFLHGVTDSWRSFEPILPHLPAFLRAIAVSQRGHGGSDRPDDGYRPGVFAADVADLADALGLGPVVVVGHSMGSHNAQRFALDHPGRAAGLVLAGAFHRLAGNPAVEDFVATVVSTLTDPIPRSVAVEFQESTLARPVAAGFLDMVVSETLKVPARVWRDAFSGLLADDHSDRLASIGVPTLIVWGDQDPFCPRSDQAALLDAIGDSRLSVHGGGGHAVHWEDPVRFAAEVVDFVGTLR